MAASDLMRPLLFIASIILWGACGEPDFCDWYATCVDDDDCHPPTQPRGKCLNDGVVGQICGIYHDSCPTKLRWYECGGTNGKKSPWAGRCVRVEFLTDGGSTDLLDAAFADAPPG